MEEMLHSLDPIALILGRIVLIIGGVALTTFIGYYALEFVATKFCKGHNILQIVRKIADEKYTRKHGHPPVRNTYVGKED